MRAELPFWTVSERYSLVRRVIAGVVVLDEKNCVSEMTEYARECLKTYFGYTGQSDRRLPAALQRWIRSETKRRRLGLLPKPFPMYQSKGLKIIWMQEGDTGSWLIVTQFGVGHVAPVFEMLGLTSKECSVSEWMTEGKSNSEIGIILSMSTNTVRKHVEHILRKLGVETRAAAVRKIWELRTGL